MSIVNRLRRAVRLMIRSQLIAGRFASRAFTFKPLSGAEAVVLMCLWNRPSRITTIVEMLDAQDYPHGTRLYLWNNNRGDHDIYLEALRTYVASGALARVDIVKSPHNLGSIARFYWARKIGRRTPHIPVIVLDDDQDIDSGFVGLAMAAYDPGAISAWWAWRVGTDGYGDRQPAEQEGPVDHVGPGGSVLGVDIFSDPTFFTAIPEKFRMLDDLWLTYFAKQHGIELRKLPVAIDFVMDETNQYHGQWGLKTEFFDYLYPKP